MPLDPQRALHLNDAQGRCLGRVSIERIEGDRLFGRFIAGGDFEAVRSLFCEFDDAVNDQLFRDADRLSGDIDALDLRLVCADGSDSLALEDVQIMNESDLSCRVPDLGLIQTKPSATEVAQEA